MGDEGHLFRRPPDGHARVPGPDDMCPTQQDESNARGRCMSIRAFSAIVLSLIMEYINKTPRENAFVDGSDGTRSLSKRYATRPAVSWHIAPPTNSCRPPPSTKAFSRGVLFIY